MERDEDNENAGVEMDKVMGAERAAQDAAMKAGAHAENELERRVSNLEVMLESVIKQNCLRTEGGR